MRAERAEDAAWRLLQAQERFEAYRQAQWAQRSWWSKWMWTLFN